VHPFTLLIWVDAVARIDSSVRIAYHPVIHKASRIGDFNFSSDFNKTKIQTYIQRITIYNSKLVSISRMHVYDQVPVSEDERIKVALVCPALTAPAAEEGAVGNLKEIAQVVKVQNGVNAQWHSGGGEGDPALGKDGKIKWTCELAPQEKVTLSLEYTVSAPAGVTLAGI